MRHCGSEAFAGVVICHALMLYPPWIYVQRICGVTANAEPSENPLSFQLDRGEIEGDYMISAVSSRIFCRRCFRSRNVVKGLIMVQRR